VNIVQKILSQSENTIGAAQGSLIVFKQISRLTDFGEQRINAELKHITLLAEQLGKVLSLGLFVKDAVTQKALHITTTMTSLLQLLGFVNLATSKDTKKF
jgi:uncharacterized membrane protein